MSPGIDDARDEPRAPRDPGTRAAARAPRDPGTRAGARTSRDPGTQADDRPPRDPDALLAELGARLSAAYAAPPPRRGFADARDVVATARGLRPAAPRRVRRSLARVPGWALVLACAMLLGGPAAFATRDALRSDPLPSLPDRFRTPGAAFPDTESGQVLVGGGTERGVAWRLSASACRYGELRAVGLFLTVPGGGGGARCDAVALSPRALAARRVQTYFDPVTVRTWVFGALPAGAVRAEVRTQGYGGARPAVAAVPTVPVDPATTARGIPAGLRTFVLALDGSRDVAAVTARDAAGTVVLRCRARRCELP